jgi:hypothetical protein
MCNELCLWHKLCVFIEQSVEVVHAAYLKMEINEIKRTNFCCIDTMYMQPSMLCVHRNVTTWFENTSAKLKNVDAAVVYRKCKAIQSCGIQWLSHKVWSV